MLTARRTYHLLCFSLPLWALVACGGVVEDNPTSNTSARRESSGGDDSIQRADQQELEDDSMQRADQQGVEDDSMQRADQQGVEDDVEGAVNPTIDANASSDTDAQPARSGVTPDDGDADERDAAAKRPLDRTRLGTLEFVAPVNVKQVERTDLHAHRSHTEINDEGLSRHSVAAAPSCNVADLELTRWPLDGTNGRDWLINNYLDRDSTSGLRDYLGFTGSLARTYDGHRGVDIDISTFREMDDGSAKVRAVAPGTVVFIREDQFDRNMVSLGSCSATWNVVQVEHANGFSTVYGHLKRNSVPVQVGDAVAAGDVLGVTGSSGCSTHPHIHFEVRDCDNNRLESFELGLWTNPPAYEPPSRVMDVVLRSGGAPTTTQIKDPSPNVTVVKPNSTLGIGLSMGGHANDVVSLRLIEPNGSVYSDWSWTVGGADRYRHMFPAWSRTIGSTPGKWRLEVRVNNAYLVRRTIGVSNYTPGLSEVAKHHVSDSSYQRVFDDITAAGYRPVWVDGYRVGSRTYFNAIFRAEDGTRWYARHNLSSSAYQDEFDERRAGYRPLQLDSYLRNGAVRYAIIFVKKSGPSWRAYHARTASQHQNLFENYGDDGYRPVNVSVVSVGGQRIYAGFYERKNLGSYVLKSYLTPAQYQAEYNDNIEAGRHLAYVNGYVHGGSVRLSAIWNETPVGTAVARHGLSVSGYQNNWQTHTGNGLLTRFVSGYANGSHAAFVAQWTSD
jgi:murein DD-endopeptidase MepM/ murein hydrolase activator NlpD